MYIGIAAEKAGDMATGKAFLSRAVDGLREQSRLGMLAQALVHHAWVATHTGDWKEAIRDGIEAATLARDTQQPQFGVTGELVAALARGRSRGGPDRSDRLSQQSATNVLVRSRSFRQSVCCLHTLTVPSPPHEDSDGRDDDEKRDEPRLEFRGVRLAWRWH